MPQISIRRIFLAVKCYSSKIFLFAKRYSSDLRKLSLLFFVQFFVILPFLYWDVPWSFYFKIRNKKTNFEKLEIEHNNLRVAEAKKYFHDLDPISSFSWYDKVLKNYGNGLDIVVSIVTTNRYKKQKRNLGYLLQSVAQMDKIIKNPMNSRKMFMFVCNVDKEPDKYNDSIYLKSYLPFVERFGDSLPKIPQLLIPNTNISFHKTLSKQVFEKESLDYIFCLQAAKTWKSKYVLVLQDDAVAMENFLDIIDYVQQYSFHGNQKLNSMTWAALKLFYPEKWTGYAFELDRISELCATGIVGATFFILIFYNVRSIFRKNFNVFTCFMVGFIFSVCSCCVIGRQNILQFRRISLALFQIVPAPGCCIPAMLYQSSLLDDLSASMYNDAFKPNMKTDFAVANFLRNYEVPSFLIVPNLFYHVGRITSLSKSNKPPAEFLYDFRI